MKKRYYYFTVIIVIIFGSFALVSAISNHSARALKDEDRRISLLADAYGVMTELLFHENLLPEYSSARILEENLFGWGILSQSGLKMLAAKLEVRYRCPFSVSFGHDWMEIPRGGDIALVYFFISPDHVYKGFNKIRVEGFINSNKNPVVMDYTYRNSTWVLVSAEVYESKEIDS